MRNAFYHDDSLIYLNSANLSLCPKPITDAISRYREDFERNPTRGLAESWGHLWSAQKTLASFLGADPADLFLRANVTAVLNAILLGMPLAKGCEILVGEFEYGAIVNICRMRAERENLGLRVLRLPGTPVAFRRASRETLVELITSQFTPQTRMVLLSHVVGGTGLVMPLPEIAKATRERNILLVVDGAYAPGAMKVDFATLGDVDFYGCSLYKWMMGPKGTAFGWVAKRHQPHLAPLQGGWTSYRPPPLFSAFGEGNPFQAAFLMSGCHDFAPYRAIRDTIDFWRNSGAENIYLRMETLRRHLADAVETRLGWRRLSSADLSLNGPMLAYLLPQQRQSLGPTLAEEVLKRFQIQLNQMELRGKWYAVFSPHICNNEEELSDAVKRLESL